MSKKAKPLNVLYIEDNDRDYDRLQLEANPYRIVMKRETNLEDGIHTFKEKGEKYFDGIILDALCRIKRDDSSPKKGHLLKAWREFSVLAPNLLKVIFTGETAVVEELDEYLEDSDVPIFNKGSSDDVRRMLHMFVEESKHKEDRIIASKYADVFEVFERGYLDSDDRGALLECIKNMYSDDEAKIKNTIAGIRRLQESIYKALKLVNRDMVPDKFFPNGQVDFRKLQKHLRGYFNPATRKCEGEEYVPYGTNIDQLAELIYTVASNYGSHKKYSEVSRYTLSAITFAALALLLWVKSEVEKRND